MDINRQEPTATTNTTPLANKSISFDRLDTLILALLLLAAGFLFLSGIGSYSLWDPWEPKYPQVVREMFARGDLVTPYYLDEIRWAKPILFYWAMAVPMLLGGNNELTARLPSGIAALLGIALVYFLLRKIRGRSAAIMGACILATIPQYFYMARQAMPDMLLTLFLEAAMAFFALGCFAESRHRFYFLLSYASVGLAFLTKGPVAPAITLVAFALFLIADIDRSRLCSPRTLLCDLKGVMRKYHVAAGAAVFFLFAAPWYLGMWLVYGYSFIDRFFRGENIHRFAEAVRGHDGRAVFYIQDFLHGMYPWSCLLPLALIFLFCRHDSGGSQSKQRWYYLCWFFAIFLVFSAAGTKIDHYILPITPLLAIILAIFWEEYFSAKPFALIQPAFLISAALLLLPIRDFLSDGSKYIFNCFTIKRAIENVNLELFFKWFVAAWALTMLFCFLRKRSRLAAALAVLTAYSNGIYFCHYVMPIHDPIRNVRQQLEYVEEHNLSESLLILYGSRRPHSPYYYYGPSRIRYFRRGEERSVAELVLQQGPSFVILSHDAVEKLTKKLPRYGRFKWTYTNIYHPRYIMIKVFERT